MSIGGTLQKSSFDAKRSLWFVARCKFFFIRSWSRVPYVMLVVAVVTIVNCVEFV